MPAIPPRLATAADLAALPDDVSAEVVAGALLALPIPSPEHAEAQATLTELLSPFRTATGGRPGGWWLSSSVDLELGPHDVYCPDLVGWRWERHARRPTGTPVRIRPDWVCEVVSPATRRRDHVDKLRALHRAGVPHYWLVDPAERALLVHSWRPEGYLIVLVASDEERVHAEPFEDLPLSLGDLFAGRSHEPLSESQAGS